MFNVVWKLLQYKEVIIVGDGAHPLMTTNDMASQLTTMAYHPLLKVSCERLWDVSKQLKPSNWKMHLG